MRAGNKLFKGQYRTESQLPYVIRVIKANKKRHTCIIIKCFTLFLPDKSDRFFYILDIINQGVLYVSISLLQTGINEF
jgi:hypothetical protein